MERYETIDIVLKFIIKFLDIYKFKCSKVCGWYGVVVKRSLLCSLRLRLFNQKLGKNSDTFLFDIKAF